MEAESTKSFPVLENKLDLEKIADSTATNESTKTYPADIIKDDDLVKVDPEVLLTLPPE